MITCRRFDPTGKFVGSVSLDLKKSAVATRLMSAIHSEKRGVNFRHVEQLDSGTLPLDVLRQLFSPSEIERAVARRISALEVESDELRELQKLLGEGGAAFADAQGGERAAFRTSSSKSRAAEADLRKSMDATDCTSNAKSYGWRPSKSTADGGLELHHDAHQGHSLEIDADGRWEHRRRGGVKVAAGHAGDLGGHLQGFHEK